MDCLDSNNVPVHTANGSWQSMVRDQNRQASDRQGTTSSSSNHTSSSSRDFSTEEAEGDEVSDAEDDDDAALHDEIKARFRTNEKLLSDVLNDSVVPAGEMIEFQSKIDRQRDWATYLSFHADYYLAELRHSIEEHQLKKQRMMEADDEFMQQLLEWSVPVSAGQQSRNSAFYNQNQERLWAEFATMQEENQIETLTWRIPVNAAQVSMMYGHPANNAWYPCESTTQPMPAYSQQSFPNEFYHYC